MQDADEPRLTVARSARTTWPTDGEPLRGRRTRGRRPRTAHDPLDEQAALLLKHHGLAARPLWVTDDGFALLHDERSTWRWRRTPAAAVRYGARRRPPLAGARRVTAWSHGDHPAARVLAERHGFAPARELWVMRRDVATPLPELTTARACGPRLPARGRGRAAAGQRRGVRRPPRAGGDGRGRPGRADGRAVVRPGRAAGRRRRATGCSASTGPSSTHPSSARSTSSASTRPPRDAASAGR